MADNIRIGLIGAGRNTKLRHIPGFQELKGVEIVTVANRTEQSSRAVAKKFKIPRTSPDWRAVVEDEKVDAICIGTWPYLHAEASVAALNAGKHVLTEARMARNVAEAEKMLEASNEHPDLVAQIVPSPFTLGVDQGVREWVESGNLGELREVHIVHTNDLFANAETPLNWRQDIHFSGYNMLTLGIYHEIIQRWFPNLAVKWVQANGAIHTPKRKHFDTGKNEEVRLPDTLQVSGQSAAGAWLFYTFSAVERGPGRNLIILNGSTGTLRLDVASRDVEVDLGNGPKSLDIPQNKRGSWRVEADFIDSIREGKPVTLTTFEDGLKYMQFTEAVYHSWNEKCIRKIQ